MTPAAVASGAQRAWRGVAVAGVLALAAGCGGGGPVRDPKAVGNEVATQAEAILDMTHITGKTTEAAPPHGIPMDMSCDDDNDNSPNRALAQMWSLYGVDNASLGKGMANLAANLPKQGWKVLSNGPDSSRNRNQEIQAVHLATKIQLDATWQKNLAYGDPIILFDVYSRCFHAEDGAGGDTGS